MKLCEQEILAHAAGVAAVIKAGRHVESACYIGQCEGVHIALTCNHGAWALGMGALLEFGNVLASGMYQQILHPEDHI